MLWNRQATRGVVSESGQTDMTVDTYKANEPDLLGRTVTVNGIAECSIGVDICTMYSPANPLGVQADSRLRFNGRYNGRIRAIPDCSTRCRSTLLR
jgi:hypothetical protein